MATFRPLAKRNARAIADRRIIREAIKDGKITPVSPDSHKLNTDVGANIPGRHPFFPNDEVLGAMLRTHTRREIADHFVVSLGFVREQVKRIGPPAHASVRCLPPDNELTLLLINTPWASIASTYGVSRAAVSKAAKRLRISHEQDYIPPPRVVRPRVRKQTTKAGA